MATASLFEPVKEPSIFPTTSGAIRQLLLRRFCAPEWALFFEVANGTGAIRPRYADAVAMNLWPSRGLSIHGFEIKISRSDWQVELKNPVKADELARHCDHWWIVAAKGVVRDGELPPTWGLYEIDGRGVTMKVQAPKLAEPALTREFMAALVRRAGEFAGRNVEDEVKKRIVDAEAGLERRIDERVKYRTRELERHQYTLEAFEKAAGFKIGDWDAETFGAAARLVKDLGITSAYGGIRETARAARRFAEQVDEAFRDRDGAEGGDANAAPVLQDRQARPEGIAQ